MPNQSDLFKQRENGFFTPNRKDGAPLYDLSGTRNGEVLDFGIGQDYVAVATINDADYYELPNGLFVSVNDAVTFTMGAPVNGIFTVTVDQLDVVNTAALPTGDVLTAGQTRKVDYVQSIGDERYYAIETGRFVRANAGTFETEQTVNPPEPLIAAGQVTYIPGFGIPVWTLQHEHVKTPSSSDKQLRHGARVRIQAKAKIGDSFYYQVGQNEWVDANYVTILH